MALTISTWPPSITTTGAPDTAARPPPTADRAASKQLEAEVASLKSELAAEQARSALLMKRLQDAEDERAAQMREREREHERQRIGSKWPAPLLDFRNRDKHCRNRERRTQIELRESR